MAENTNEKPVREQSTASEKQAGREQRGGTQSMFRILDVRDNDMVLEMEDGRAFVASVKDGVDISGARTGQTAVITSDGMDSSDAPKDAVVTDVRPAAAREG